MKNLAYNILGSIIMAFAPVSMRVLDIVSIDAMLIIAVCFLIAGLLFLFMKWTKRVGWSSIAVSSIFFALWGYGFMRPASKNQEVEISQNPIMSFLPFDSLRIRYEQRDPEAISSIAEQMVNIVDSVKDGFYYYDRLLKDVEEAASQNYAGAYYVLGLMHSKGFGCPKDSHLAASYLVKCIDLAPQEPAGYALLESLGEDVQTDPAVNKRLEHWNKRKQSIELLKQRLLNEIGERDPMDVIKELYSGNPNSKVFRLIAENRLDFDVLNHIYNDKFTILLASYCYGVGDYQSSQEYLGKAIAAKVTCGAERSLLFFPNGHKVAMNNLKKVLLYSNDYLYNYIVSTKQSGDPFVYYAVWQARLSRNEYLYKNKKSFEEEKDSLINHRKRLIIAFESRLGKKE